jgi:serine/threonine protein phosphatase PrpC
VKFMDATFNISVYAKTDVGRVRSGNEDSFLILNLTTSDAWLPETILNEIGFAQGDQGCLLAVTDGMGGALAGEVASRMAVESVRELLMNLQTHSTYQRFPFCERLRFAIEITNLRIHYESLNRAEYSGMGATFTAAGLYGDTAYFAQIGDSRAYLMRGRRIKQITRDQSLVGQLVEAGHLTEEEAERHAYKNVILQALGATPYINVALNSLQLRNGDTLLLCSDGLSNKVRGEEMSQVIEQSSSLEEACERLVDLANERGGEDNITVLIARMSGEGLQAPSEAELLSNQWEIREIPRDPELPQEIDLTLADDEDTLPDD